MKIISLTKNKKALVDDSDFEFLNQYKWSVTGSEKYGFKAVRGFFCMKNGKPFRRLILMHRIITMCHEEFEVDHIDGNGLNNQKSNLRFCTHGQNMRNRTKRSVAASKYKGVHFRKDKKLWRAKMDFENKCVLDKNFKSENEAALAYNEAALKHHGEFARLNILC